MRSLPGTYVTKPSYFLAEVPYSHNEDSVIVKTRRRYVILEINTSPALLELVFLGFSCLNVTKYMDTATQSYKCQRYGHIAKPS